MTQQMSRIVSFAAALLLGGAVAHAQAPQGTGPQGQAPVAPGTDGQSFEKRHGPRGPQEMMTRMLDLNESQQEKLREILEQGRPQREALHEKMSANRDALRQLLESGTADANAVGELVLEGRRLHDEGRTLHEAEQKSIRALLNPDQQKKFDAMAERMRQRGPDGGFGPGGGMGGFGPGMGGPGGMGGQNFGKPRSQQPPPDQF
jgi:Spy/CpxP family protein refolding chaperone